MGRVAMPLIVTVGILALFVLLARRIWYQAMAHLNL
jgi:hypothetical protein